MNIVDSIIVILIRVFWICFIDLWVVFFGGKFFFVIICLMFFIIMMVLFINRLMVSIILNIVSVFIEKLKVVRMVKVLSNIIGMVMVGINVVWKFCRNRYIMRKIRVIVFSSVFIMFLMEVLINEVVLYVILYFSLCGKYCVSLLRWLSISFVVVILLVLEVSFIFSLEVGLLLKWLR